jgi:hypothetical protein
MAYFHYSNNCSCLSLESSSLIEPSIKLGGMILDMAYFRYSDNCSCLSLESSSLIETSIKLGGIRSSSLSSSDIIRGAYNLIS